MFGDSFFTQYAKDGRGHSAGEFSSPCLGILFSPGNIERAVKLGKAFPFSSPCLGILFSHSGMGKVKNGKPKRVFVPMFGDSFFTITKNLLALPGILFSSPCLGILFSLSLCSPKEILFFLVFVPMFGDSFFTCLRVLTTIWYYLQVFVPMFGDSFFT